MMTTPNKKESIQPRFAVTIESEMGSAQIESQQARLAVLIDADNTSPAIIDGLVAEVAKYGVATVKRIYGDWTKPQLGGWKEVLLKYSIQPIQQFAYTTGKNATDSALIIDAMDLLYTRRFNGFCIVSSDSDFTRLAARIREEGLTVYGFGQKKTPQPFVSACDKFIYTEVLRAIDEPAELQITLPATQIEEKETQIEQQKLITLLTNAIEAVSDENGWATLSSVGSTITNQMPDFDPRIYGHKKLSELVTSLQFFEIKQMASTDGRSKTISIRNKK